MSPVVETSRSFEPGTTGWTASDLDDPEIEAQWFRGRYEIVEGVLTRMPPAYFAGGHSLFELMIIVREHFSGEQKTVRFAPEVEIIVEPSRVVRTDAAMLTPEDDRRQAAAVKAAGRQDPERTRILIPPTLVIESDSPGHEAHDEQTKKRWYAEFGVPNYWVLNAFARSLQCLRLAGGTYEVDAEGRDEQELGPTVFRGLVIPLARLWEPRTPDEPLA